MGKGGNQGEGATEHEAPAPTFTWEEIQKHNVLHDRWLVVDRKVYNITKWANRHPGGRRVIGHYAGEDATVRELFSFSSFGWGGALTLCCRLEPWGTSQMPNGAGGARERRRPCPLRAASAPRILSLLPLRDRGVRQGGPGALRTGAAELGAGFPRAGSPVPAPSAGGGGRPQPGRWSLRGPPWLH